MSTATVHRPDVRKPKKAVVNALPAELSKPTGPAGTLSAAAASVRAFAADRTVDRKFFLRLAHVLEVARSHASMDPARLGPMADAAYALARTWLAGVPADGFAEPARLAAPAAPESAEEASPVPASTPQPSGPDLAPLTNRAPDGWYRALATAQAERWGYATSMEPDSLESYIRHHAGRDTNLQDDVDFVWSLIRPLMVKLHKVVASQDEVLQAQARELAEVKQANRRLTKRLRRSVRRECTALCDEIEEDRDRLQLELAEHNLSTGQAK